MRWICHENRDHDGQVTNFADLAPWHLLGLILGFVWFREVPRISQVVWTDTVAEMIWRMKICTILHPFTAFTAAVGPRHENPTASDRWRKWLKATFAQLRRAGFELFQNLPVVWFSLDVFFTGVGCLDMPGVTLSTVQQNNQLTCSKLPTKQSQWPKTAVTGECKSAHELLIRGWKDVRCGSSYEPSYIQENQSISIGAPLFGLSTHPVIP